MGHNQENGFKNNISIQNKNVVVCNLTGHNARDKMVLTNITRGICYERYY